MNHRRRTSWRLVGIAIVLTDFQERATRNFSSVFVPTRRESPSGKAAKATPHDAVQQQTVW